MDLHRHDECSLFDGFGKAADLAQLAKKLGHKSLGISNHGNTNGLVQHYVGCKEAGIKPILGVEGYFLPVYKEQHRGFHLCLFAKNHAGYHNLNVLQSEGEKIKYYNPIWTFEMLRECHEGLICTSACVSGFLAQMIKAGNKNAAVKYIKTMKEIFGDDFYIEVQPYKVAETGLQEKINLSSMKLADAYGVKCILTSDSHRGAKEDWDTYLKMHEIAAVNKKLARFSIEDVKNTYFERYMPTDAELMMRFRKMHQDDLGTAKCRRLAFDMVNNLKEIEDKVDGDVFKDLQQLLPRVHKDADRVVQRKVKEGLEAKGKWSHCHNGLDYIGRAKQEYEVISKLGFSDYFLIVADYVNWSKERGIVIGPGRGSVCNSLVAYALNITEVDSLMFGLDFKRFLRVDKKKLPDVDLDFEQSRRHETIKYILDKYSGQTARVASYGLYKVDNLVNDLAKVCGLKTDKTIDDAVVAANKAEIRNIKTLCNIYIGEGGELNFQGLLSNSKAIDFNNRYDNIITHFTKMYKKIRYVGTHAAGVAITGGNIYDYTALRIDKDGDVYSNYDLNDLDFIKLVKFDCLGLITMGEIGEMRSLTGEVPDYDVITQDEKVIEAFGNGESQGVFQFDNKSVRKMLVDIGCDCFADVVAANAMNRPGPLKVGMPDKYTAGKSGIFDTGVSDVLREYTSDSYGTVIYQEQVQQICVNVGGMSWVDADKVMKMDVDKANAAATKANKEKNELKEKFITGAVSNGIPKADAESIFESMMVYSFNKGHATGYSLVSAEEMFYKVHNPTIFWFCKIKYAPNKDVYDKYCSYAVKSGCVVFLPHINYSEMKMSMRKVDGDYCLQQGLSEILNVGEKAGLEIYEERKRNGVFRSFDDFYDRCKSRVVNKKVIDTLVANGVAQFNKSIYLRKVTAYNSALWMRAEK